MQYSEFPNPQAPRLVTQSLKGDRWAYAIGEIDGIEYCIVSHNELGKNASIPERATVVPTASLLKFAPQDWVAAAEFDPVERYRNLGRIRDKK